MTFSSPVAERICMGGTTMTRRLFSAALPALSGVLYLASITATEAFTINGCFGGGAGPALNDYANMPLYCGTTNVAGGVTGGAPVIPAVPPGFQLQFAGSSPGAA